MFPFKTEVSIGEKELFEYADVMGRPRRVFNIIFFGVMLLLILVTNLLVYFKTGEVVLWYAILAAIIAAEFVISLFGRRFAHRRARKMVEKTGVREGFYEFFEDRLFAEMHDNTSSGTSEFRYSAFVKATETGNLLLLTLMGRSTLVIPKEGIGAEQMEALREALTAAIPGGKYKRK